MFPYFALLLIPAIFSACAISIYKKSTTALVVSISRDRNSAALPVFFFMLLMLLVLRHETVGCDILNYKYMFYEYTQWGAEYVFSIWQEVLFRGLNWLIMKLTGSFRVFLIVTAMIAVLPIAYVYNQDKTHGFLKIAVFVNMSTFIMLFSGIRQSMAMGIGMLAYQMVKEKKHWQFLLLATLSMLVHHSGLMVFFMYPLYHIRFRKIHLLAIIPAFVMVLVFNRPIFKFLAMILESTYDKYSIEIVSTGAYGSLILFAIFSVFAYVVVDEKNCDVETLGLRNFLLFATMLQCFAPVHSLAMRMNYYYILFIPLALGKCMNNYKKSMRQVVKMAEIVLCVFFTIFFMYNTYQSFITGKSTLDTIPYVPFWKNP